jgi:anti-anti-sigma factor
VQKVTQTGKRAPFTIERKNGKAPGTVIFHLRGPFTARDIFESLSPDTLNSMLDLQSMSDNQQITLNIFDLTEVPYVDSSGLGMIVRHYARCRNQGVEFIAAAASPRVLELFRITKVDGVLPMTATLEQADIH